jgi:hypothetical protein
MRSASPGAAACSAARRPGRHTSRWLLLACGLLLLGSSSAGAEAAVFGSPGGPEPTNLRAVADGLQQDAGDLELLISFGTSKGGSAGHLALAVHDAASPDGRVYSANFYADRSREHEAGFYVDELMLAIPKIEYLFGTRSSLGAKASFGLDFGEVYKRSVIGLRVSGVPIAERQSLVAYFQRINDDYRQRARDTEYHDGEVKYDYLRLNCAKTIGAAFKFGAQYSELEVTSAPILSRRRLVAAAHANVPTEMAMKLLDAWHARGYRMDVVLYRKYGASTWKAPDEDLMFKDLPDRFPSVLSRDFRREQGQYEDFDNLLAMYLLANLAKYVVHVDETTKRLEIRKTRMSLDYPAALESARRDALQDSENYLRGLPVATRRLAVEPPVGPAPQARAASNSDPQ